MAISALSGSAMVVQNVFGVEVVVDDDSDAGGQDDDLDLGEALSEGLGCSENIVHEKVIARYISKG